MPLTRLWLRWTLANAWAEFVGLGSVAAFGYLVTRRVGEPSSLTAAIALAAVFVALGAIEGLVVGVAQDRVLRRVIPQVSGWVRATVIGAVASWALGFVPSTIMSAVPQEPNVGPPEIGEFQRLMLAAALGLLAGPLLAFFQWRRLRGVFARAWLWLPANALAWAAGMPVIFYAAHVAVAQTAWQSVVAAVAVSLLLAGAVVGAIHGFFLVRFILPHRQPEA